MQELLTLNSIGQSGLNSDVSAWELGPEYFTYGANVRVRNGKVLPFGGSKQVIGPPIIDIGTAGYLLHVRIRQGDFWIQCSTTHILAVRDINGWYDVTETPFNIPTENANRWSGCQLGQVVVVNHPEVGPLYWAQSAQAHFLPLPFTSDQTWAERGLACNVMRSHKNFLIAMGLRGVEDSPNGYRISHPADIDGYPYTWSEQDRSSIAIRAQLGSDGGDIIDGRSLRDSFVIYSQDAIDILDFNAGSEFYWKRRELSSTVGLLSLNCLAEVKGKHFLIVDGDIIVNDGANISSIIHNRIARRFNAGVNSDTKLKSFAVKNDALKEVWFCVPEDEAEFANIAYVYNWKDDSWSIKDLPEQTVSADYGANPFTSDEDPDFDTWDKDIGTWTEDVTTWGSERLTALNDDLIGLNIDGSIVNLDPKGSIDETVFATVVERVDFPLDGHRNFNTITRLYPHVSGDDLAIQIGSQPYIGGPVTWGPEDDFDPANQRKIDVRVTGMTLCWRIISKDTNRFLFSGMDIEYSPAGVR